MDHDIIHSWKFVVPQSLALATLVFLPLSLKRNMDAFKYISMASIMSLVYTAVVLIIEAPEYWRANIGTAKISPFYIDLNIFQGMSMTFYAFQC